MARARCRRLPTDSACINDRANGIGTELRFDLTRSGLGRTAAFWDFAFAPELKPNGTGYRAYTYVHLTGDLLDGRSRLVEPNYFASVKHSCYRSPKCSFGTMYTRAFGP
jgi:hypothetical protein